MPKLSAISPSHLVHGARRVRRALRDWRSLQQKADGFEDFLGPHRLALRKVGLTRFYRYSEQYTIHGWLTPRERSALYALARWLPGPFLEIGSWAGLSTTAIARGIKDSGQKKEFHTIDLNPTSDNFIERDGRIGFLTPGSGEPIGFISPSAYRAMIPVLSYPGGPIGLLQENLRRFGLSDVPSIHIGDYRKLAPQPYTFVFCDVLHDPVEIRRNAPDLNTYLRPGSVLAAHDIGRSWGGVDSRDLVAALRECVPLGHSVIVDSLYIAEVVESEEGDR